MKYRFVSLLLCLMMLAGILAGCASDKAEEAPVSEEPAVEAPVEEAPPADEPAPEEEVPVEEPAEPPVELMSIPFEETQTITIWDVFPPPLAGFMEGPWDCSAMPVLEEALNAEFEYTTTSTETASEMFNLMVAGGDYCDLIYGVGTYYTSGADMAIEDELIIDLEDLSKKVPNFQSLWEEYPDSVMLSSEGRLYMFPLIITDPFNDKLQGMSTRGDWIDALGCDLPVTYDDFRQLMMDYHTEFGAKGGYLLSNDGFSAALANGFGASNGFYQVDGKVKYGPLEPGYKDYVEYVADLYANELIVKDFYTMMGAPTDSITSTDVTVWTCDVGMWSFFTSGITTPDYYTVGFSSPVVNEGDITHLAASTSTASSEGLSISTDCEQLDVIAAAINYMYSDEFAITANFGIEGEGLVYDEDGNPHLSDLVLHNTDTIMSFAVKKYTMFTYFPYQEIQTKYMDAYDQVQLDTIAMWSSGSDDLWVIPDEASLNAEDSELAAEIMADISTSVDEYLLGFITGSISLDQYDTFLENIRSMDVQTAIDLYQKTYDEYLAATE